MPCPEKCLKVVQPLPSKVSLWLPVSEDGWEEGGGGAMSPILEEEEARGRWEHPSPLISMIAGEGG